MVRDACLSKHGQRASGRGACGQIISPAICPAVAMKARLLGIISSELVTEELAACGAPWLQFAVHDRQRLAAERTACRCAVAVGVCAHQVPPVSNSKTLVLARRRERCRRGSHSFVSSCEYQHSRVDRRRLLRKRHSSAETKAGYCVPSQSGDHDHRRQG